MHSFQCHRYHIIFSTKNREPVLKQDWEVEIRKYFHGIAREKDIRTYAAGGIEDHIYLLCGISSSKTVADAVQELKGNASRWLKQRFDTSDMQWQIGYASFTVCASAMDAAVRYIQNQRLHHQKENFETELNRIIFLHEKGEAYLHL